MIAGLAPLPRFAPVEDAEHQNGAAVVPVLKRLCATEDLKEDLAVFFATCYGSPKLRMPTEKDSPLDKLTGDARGEVGELFVQERGKSTEVGEGVERPFGSLLARPLSEPGRAPRAEPLHHTVMWHPRAVHGFGRSTIELRELIGVRFPRGAVECCQFGDQLRNGHAELGRSHLKHVRGALVDLDTDAGVHGTRIADPEPASGMPVRPANVVRFASAVVTITDCKSLMAQGEMLVSRIFTSWNQMAGWLRRVEGLRAA